MSGETPTVGETPTTPTLTPDTPPAETPQDKPLDFAGWLGQQPDEIKALVDDHVSGLKSALQSERGSRGQLEKQLADLKRKLEAGSDAAKQLETIQAGLAEEGVKTAFYEAAHAAGASDLRLAYIAAKDAGLIDDRGKFDLDAVKAKFPVLFAAPKTVTVAGVAGAGTGNQPPARSGSAAVNDFIRRSAGVRD